MESLFLFILISFLLITMAVVLYYLIYDICLWKYFINNANKFEIKFHIADYYGFQWGDYFAFITPNKIVSIHNKNNKCLLTGMNVIYSNKMYKEFAGAPLERLITDELISEFRQAMKGE